MKKVSIIIINYNTKDILLDCIKNLQKSDYKNIEIIVVDNGSSDGSIDAVIDTFSDVKAIRSENNGLSAGSNLGLKHSSGDYILYLGSDAFPYENTISGMVEYFESNQEVGAATCELLLRDGSVDMDAHRGFPTPWAALTHFSKLNKIFPKSAIFLHEYFFAFSMPAIINLFLRLSSEDICVNFSVISILLFGSKYKTDSPKISR